jgi:hypothetical protein
MLAPTLSWSKAVSTLGSQGSKALFSLKKYTSLDSHTPIKSIFYLFEKTIVPILLYGAEIWGFQNYKQLEKLQINLCKYVLGVPKRTSNDAALGDCGRFPLYVLYYVRCIKYWLKISLYYDLPYVQNC